MFSYFYGQQAEQFSFYRIPKVLFTSPQFRYVSAEAKTLYGILLDRMNLSAKNCWQDEDGRVFIIFTVEEIIIEQYKALQTPFKVGYHEGWIQVSEQLPNLMKYCIILLSFLLAGIFSDEFIWKTDAVYYNTYHGRTRSTIIKLLLGFLSITLVYWLCVGSFSLVILGSLGTEGADHMLQSYSGNWSIRYNMTFLQYYWLILGAGYLGFLFTGFLVMWVSAKTKSPIFAVLIPSLMLLLPMFLREIYSLVLRKVIGLLPHWLMDIGQALRYQYLYDLGGQVTCLVPIILVLYSCLTLFLVFLSYWENRHKQVT